MPRFGTKSLLIGFAVAALWLSTFAAQAADFAVAQDVRKSILLFIFLASGFAALYTRGRRRAFWAGFFAVMLLCGGLNWGQPLHKYVPDFNWQWSSATVYSSPPMYVPAQNAIQPNLPAVAPMVANGVTLFPAPAPSSLKAHTNATLAAGWTLILAIVIGFVGAYIYDQGQKQS